MDIYYTNETLYVNVLDLEDEASFFKMKRRIFRILEDYGISRVELNLLNFSLSKSSLLDDLVLESKTKYQTKLTIN